MILIQHRRNARAELEATPAEWGVEVDIRSRGPDLIIHHDPFKAGETLIDWLGAYRHRYLILNVKEEGLEDRLLTLMAAHGIEDFFFLDQSFPFLVRTANGGEKRCAVRISEYESIDTALSLAGHIDWVWVDCFTRFPLDRNDAERLKAAGFKLCLVSPELQGRNDPGEIDAMRQIIDDLGIEIDAVCSKTPDRWQ
jgi:hypothetical protein